MNTNRSLRCILFSLCLVVLTLTGCENPPWESGMTLVLKIETPQDGATVSAPNVTISGRVAGSEGKAAKVSIKEAEVPVKDGKFSAEVALTEGKNEIKIVATAGQATLNEQRTVTYTPAKQ